VREEMRWHLIDRAGAYDFSSARPMLEAARAHGIDILWNLCHYGWPDDVELMSPAFVDRFARYCAAAARHVADHTDGTRFYCPINEISFFAWAAGEVGYIHPYGRDHGHDVKRQLVRAAIAGMEAIWAVDPGARIIQIDPLIHVVPPAGRPDLAAAAADQRERQFHAWSMLAGLLDPDLGGHPRYLDVIGVNYYHANQWEHPDIRLRWEDTPRDPRWVPFRDLLAEVHGRYGRPLIIAETSHFGSGRARWIAEITDEVLAARAAACWSRGSVSTRSSTGPTGTWPTRGTTAACGTCARSGTATEAGCGSSACWPRSMPRSCGGARRGCRGSSRSLDGHD
jgi:hypothetical protein